MRIALNKLLIGILLFSIVLKAQNTANKIKVHKVWVTLVDGSNVKGNLYAADKEGIKIIKNKETDISNLIMIRAENISVVKIRRKGKIGNGALIGGLSGAGLSVLLGLTTNDDGFFTKEEVMAISSVLFVPLGTGIGALAGSKRMILAINGDKELYNSNLEIIRSYSIRINSNIIN